MSTFKLGITGSIGMGKTQTAEFFRQEGVPVWDADKTVHELYKNGEKGYNAIKAISSSLVNEYEVDRKKLLNYVTENKKILSLVEKQIHPLLKENQKLFIESKTHHKILVFDIPLLFEKNNYWWLDATLVVRANEKEQRKRVLERRKMSMKQFNYVNSKQISTDEKCKLADFIVDTDKGFSHAKIQVKEIIEIIKGKIL